MKPILLILALHVCQIVSSQEGVTRSVGDFSEVKIFDGISAQLIKSTEDKISISGENPADVVTVNNSGKLKVRMEANRIFDGAKISVQIYYTGVLEAVDVNENAYIWTAEPIEQVNLELRAQEGGKMKVSVAVQRLNVKSVTGGEIETTGVAKNQDVQVNTGGHYEGDGLQTEQTTIDVNAGGRAYINASEYVKATVRAGGTIRVYGNPKVLDKQTFLGGRIIEQ
jgi:hypothetical protein